MVLGPRHATTFRRFGDRAIVTGLTTVPCPVMPKGNRELPPGENPAPRRTLARTCPRPGRRRASRDAARTALARTALARTALARTALARTALARTALARTALARTAPA